MKDIGEVDQDGTPLYSFHGLRKNAACYLAEAGLADTDIGSMLGMTSETVRHYTKRKRAYMIARRAADTVGRGDVLQIKGGRGK
jgi:predicted transcriptional regulator